MKAGILLKTIFDLGWVSDSLTPLQLVPPRFYIACQRVNCREILMLQESKKEAIDDAYSLYAPWDLPMTSL